MSKNEVVDKDKISKDKIMTELVACTTVEAATATIRKYYPFWIIYTIDEYCPDYPILIANWNKICELTKSTPKKIVLVEELKFEEKEHPINFIAEYLTRQGYCVRRACEYLVCQKCEKAIPVQELWAQLRDRGLQVPKIWSDKCEKCR